MASSNQRYPLSTADGNPIPLDIIKPRGVLIINFLTASASANFTLPADVEILSVVSTAECFVQFGATAVKPATGIIQDNCLMVPKNMRITVAPIDTVFSVIGASSDGTLKIQLIDKWAGLALETQYRKR